MEIAAFKGNIVLLNILLARSSEQLLPNPEGKSLLHFSAYGGSLKCLQYLKSRGIDLGALDKQKRTCLHHAAASLRERSCAVLEYLLEQGLDPNQRDVDGWTPLFWAAKAGNITNAQRLLGASTHTNVPGDLDWIPFAIATYHDSHRVAAILAPSDRALPERFKTQHFSTSLLHGWFICDGCELVSRRNLDVSPLNEIADSLKSIFGSRYRCSECPDFDYCFKCMLSAGITHPSHRFDFTYWDDTNQDVQGMDRQEVMREVVARETLMTSFKA